MSSKITASRASGIEMGTRLVGHPRGEAVLAGQYALIEEHRTLIGANGEKLAAPSKAREAQAIAYAQGFIASYRSATEH